MSGSGKQVRLFLILDVFFFLFCAAGIYHLDQKADLPFTLIKSENSLIIGKPAGDLTGDTLVAINGMQFVQREEIEIYLDSKSIGDKIPVSYLDNGKIKTVQTTLTQFYPLPFIIVNSLAGFLFILFGIFVFLKCPDLRAAKIFHWGSVGIAVMLLYTWGKYTVYPFGLGVAVRIIFQFAYTLTPASFLHFSLNFPKDREKRFKYLILSVYAAAVIIAFLNIYYFVKMLPELTETGISNYFFVFNLNRIFAILCILAAILVFLLSYKNAGNNVEKKKLKWVLSGFLIGPLSFALFWAFPIIIKSKAFIPEIFLPFLMLFIPFTFAIAIVRYHLMDIDLLIRRSIVYTVAIVFLIIIYIAIISAVSSRILSVNYQTPFIAAAIIVALLFEPLRKKVQLYIDKKFFRVQYNFGEALKIFLRTISEVNTIDQLANMFVREAQEFIPVEKIGFFLLKKGYLRLIAHNNFNLLINRSLKFDAANLKSDLSLPVANPSKVEAGINFESADITTFKRWGMDLVIPVKATTGEIYAFLVLGGKKSGDLFTIEDIDLLMNVASNIASTISRIYLQEELIRKNLETERLEELNKQKTVFVSTVSHDLKTPLSSIKIFSEIMKDDQQVSAKQKKYLEIIEGESDRLTRLINNVLNFAWIEKGTRQYSFDSISLNSLVHKVLDTLNYQIKMEGFEVETKLCQVDWTISADADAVMEALFNVIANAIKYSVKQKVIFISTFRAEKYFCVEVRDKGIGIHAEDLRNLFQPFFRSKIAGSKKISGTGLGLSIIKHIMDAHNGKIEVESIPDEGTSFVLKFPIEIDENESIEDKGIINNSLMREGEGS